jgi:DNA-binding beta-propeller fold protein YncE
VNSRLFVADSENNRVLVFDNVGPGGISNGMAASYVLGQSSFTAGSPNQGNAAPTSQSLSFSLGVESIPGWLAYDPVNTRLFVSDTTNNRIMVFNVPTGTNLTGEAASYELGQPAATAFTTAAAVLSQSGLSTPMGISYDANSSRLFVADFDNERVMVFTVGPGVIANGENASFVLGQTNFTGTTFNPPYTSTQSSFIPQHVFYDPGSGRLFVNDEQGNSVLIFEGSTNSTPAQFTPGYD